MYTAELKIPWNEKQAVKESRVYAAMSALGLETCKNTIIGSSLRRGLSGGQLKRTNIAMSLLSSPLVLFLDEPTSGMYAL